MTRSILLFAEDPGAANYIAPLPELLSARGWHPRLLACAAGAQQLARLGISFEKIGPKAAGVVPEQALVVVGTSENPESPAFELIQAARECGIPSVGVVDGPGHAVFRFRGQGYAPLDQAPDWILVPDESLRSKFVGFGHPSNRVIMCGHPHYDTLRNRKRELDREGRLRVGARVLPDAPTGRSVVVFATEISDGLDPEAYRQNADYTLLGRGVSSRRTDIVLEEFIDAAAEIDISPYLVLRLHPKNEKGEFASYLDAFDAVSQSGSAFDLAYSADLVVGMTSILLAEAALLGVSTLSIIPRAEERYWLSTTAVGITPFVSSRVALREILPRAVLDPSAPSETAVRHALPVGSGRNTVTALERIAASAPIAPAVESAQRI